MIDEQELEWWLELVFEQHEMDVKPDVDER